MSADQEPAAPSFHAGEVMLQAKAGVADKLAEIGQRMVRRFMPDQHREFFAQLPYLIVGALDQDAQPWATVLSGAPGFIQSPLETRLDIGALPGAGDPLAGQLHPGAPLGLLGIEAHTRRRNRANGVVAAADVASLSVHIHESFGNCPKYIQARLAQPAAPLPPAPPEAFTRLSDRARDVIASADTFFIASAHPAAHTTGDYGVDVSHRGGMPGFVRLDRTAAGQDQLLIPDFAGNYFFNTLGNISLNPRVGLLFIDYASQDLLHLAGRAELVLDGPEIAAYAGARRLLRITIENGLLRRNALPLNWGTAEVSPFLANSGHW